MFENLLGQLESIRDGARMFLPVDKRPRLPMVASADVARVVADALLGAGSGVRGAYGPEDLSFADVGAALTAGLGRTVRIIRLPRFVIRGQMLRLGRDPRAVDAFIHSFKAITKGKMTASPARDATSTTPTSLVAWTKDVLKPLVDGDEGAACPVRVQYQPPSAAR
jgi:uncharacterized protein YbjT (DUF2867 family)